jgi:phage gp29-like protein
MTQTNPSWWRRLFGRKNSLALSQRRPRPIGQAPPGGQQFVFQDHLDRNILENTTSGAAIAQIVNAYQRAEDGDIEHMVELFDRRIEADAHLRGALENRNEAVSQKPFSIEPGGTDPADMKAAAELEERLRLVPDWIATLEHQLTFQPYGWAGSEISWELVDSLAAPVWFDNVPHRRFTFDRENDRPMLRTKDKPAFGTDLVPGKWWFTHRRGRLTATAGLMRTGLWISTFKTLTMRDFLIFSERFGIPYVTGVYDETIAPDDKETLRQAVADIGSGSSYAIVSKAAEIVIHQAQMASNSNEGVHGALIGILDNQISFLIEGATLVSSVDGPGSHALGKIHQNRYFDILLGDAERLSQSFVHSIGFPFVRFNGMSARPPRLKLHLGLNLSLGDQVDMATKLANNLEGFLVDEEQIRAITQLRKPDPGAGLRGRDFAKIEAGEGGGAGRPPEE